MLSENINIISYNHPKQNKNLFNKVKKFVETLKTDEKTIFLKTLRISFLMRTEDEICQFSDKKENTHFIYTKGELREFVKMWFLLIIFLQNKEQKCNVFESSIMMQLEDHFRVQETAFYLNSFMIYSHTNNSADKNEIYLYSDIFGIITTNILKNKVVLTQHPLTKLIKMLVKSNLCDIQIWFFIFFSMIKKEPLIMSLDEVKNFTDLSQMIDFLVNGEFIEKPDHNQYFSIELKEFQYWLREGYFNKSFLLTDFLAWVVKRELIIPLSSLDKDDLLVVLDPV